MFDQYNNIKTQWYKKYVDKNIRLTKSINAGINLFWMCEQEYTIYNFEYLYRKEDNQCHISRQSE